jgi:hypothetical protein
MAVAKTDVIKAIRASGRTVTRTIRYLEPRTAIAHVRFGDELAWSGVPADLPTSFAGGR